MNLDVIEPQRSVGDLLLGSTEREVIDLLGPDFEREIDEQGDLAIEYEDQGIRCTFWETNDFRLGWISVERPTASLCGAIPIGLSKAQIQELVSSKLKSSISEVDGVEHDDGHIQEWMNVDSHNLSFWFRDDSLYLIDVTCQWSDDDSPIWPSK